MKYGIFSIAFTFMLALQSCIRLATRDFKGDAGALTMALVSFIVLAFIFAGSCALTYGEWESQNTTEETTPRPSETKI